MTITNCTRRSPKSSTYAMTRDFSAATVGVVLCETRILRPKAAVSTRAPILSRFGKMQLYQGAPGQRCAVEMAPPTNTAVEPPVQRRRTRRKNLSTRPRGPSPMICITPGKILIASYDAGRGRFV